jgi:hypothetical protein
MRMRCSAILGLCLALALAGCFDNTGASACGTPVPNCVVTLGTASGGLSDCSDVVQSPVCQNGAWSCPSGTVPMEQCACTTRADAAQYCGDASAD